MKLVRGYSLIEMLVVLIIFSLIATISLAFLSSSTNSFLQVNSKTENLKQLIIASEVIKEDLIHVSNKLIRDEFGVKKEFLITPEIIQNGKAIEFVRVSSSDGLGDTGSMYKVKYILENGSLNRYTSNFLNSAYLKDPLELISNVSEIEIISSLNSLSSVELENLPKLLTFNIKIKENFFKKFSSFLMPKKNLKINNGAALLLSLLITSIISLIGYRLFDATIYIRIRKKIFK